MMGAATLETSVRELLRRETVRGDGSRGAEEPQPVLDAATVRWILPRLMRLADDLHGEPIEQLAPAVRRMLMEQAFVDAHGDAVLIDAERRQIDEQVAMLLRILEQARREQHANGQWATVPVTPQMFG